MNLTSSCSDCKTCVSHFIGCCLAGNGDNDYQRVTRGQYDKLIDHDEVSRITKNRLRITFPEYAC